MKYPESEDIMPQLFNPVLLQILIIYTLRLSSTLVTFQVLVVKITSRQLAM